MLFCYYIFLHNNVKILHLCYKHKMFNTYKMLFQKNYYVTDINILFKIRGLTSNQRILKKCLDATLHCQKSYVLSISSKFFYTLTCALYM